MNSPEKRSSELLDNQSLLVGDSPASPIVLQENVRHLVMNVTLQENSKESFGRLNPDGSLLRMSRGSAQANLDGSLESSCMTFPRWGILSDGVVGELRMSEPATKENGSSLWPTLLTTDAHGHGYQRDLKSGKKRLSIPGIIALIPTLGSAPRGAHKTREIIGKRCISKTTGEKWSLCLEEWIYLTGLNEVQTQLKLQPAFAEWMMGFPQGWTALDASETPSSRSKSTQSSKRSRISKEQTIQNEAEK